MGSKGSAVSAIMEFRAYPPDRYADIDLNRLTVFTISVLHEMDVASTLENIAVATFRLFPKRFAMVGFPDYPDVARVNRALLQLQPKYRNWATGKAKLGWQLTVGGEAEAKALQSRLGSGPDDSSKLAPSDMEAESGGKAKRTVYPAESVARLRGTALFARFLAGWKDVAPLEVYDGIGAYTHTPPEALRRSLRSLRRDAATVGDDEVVRFLDELGKRFAFLFQDR